MMRDFDGGGGGGGVGGGVGGGYGQKPARFEDRSQLHVTIVRALFRFDCNQQCL